MTECYLLEKCGFFKRFENNSEVKSEDLINTYCKGHLRKSCKRLQYRNQHGIAPADHMMPDGTMIKEKIHH